MTKKLPKDLQEIKDHILGPETPDYEDFLSKRNCRKEE